MSTWTLARWHWLPWEAALLLALVPLVLLSEALHDGRPYGRPSRLRDLSEALRSAK